MVKDTIVTLASTALIVLATGCATQGTNDAVARLTESDASRPAIPRELVGTWNGWFRPAGIDGGGGNSMDGVMTLVIKDDATYKLISTRRGRGDVGASNDSGVVVAKGRTITLKSSSGPWIPFTRNGNALYGVTKSRGSGHTIQMTLERAAPAAAP
jgi:hypothetical protein